LLAIRSVLLANVFCGLWCFAVFFAGVLRVFCGVLRVFKKKQCFVWCFSGVCDFLDVFCKFLCGHFLSERKLHSTPYCAVLHIAQSAHFVRFVCHFVNFLVCFVLFCKKR